MATSLHCKLLTNIFKSYKANGNRYVGQFEGGCKSGPGVYYHGNKDEGQRIQRGFWSQGVCRTSLMPLLLPR